MSKSTLREQLIKKRASLSSHRRKSASLAFLETYLPSLSCLDYVLSFASFRSEIDTWSLNESLAIQGKLVLPKMEHLSLRLFKVEDLQTQLQVNCFGILEPLPQLCAEISPLLMQTILVPALGFDSKRHRLGYGKGFYDRFLATLPSSIPTIGIGFHEQLVSLLPLESTDVALEKVSLF